MSLVDRLKAFVRGAAEIEAEQVPDIRRRRSAFSTAPSPFAPRLGALNIELQAPAFRALIKFGDDLEEAPAGATFDQALETYAMDATNIKNQFTLGQGAIPDDLFNWFSTQSFIGYQACAIISQHWLVNKALMIPAKDAVRNGYQIGSVDGDELDLDLLSKLQAIDKAYNIPANLIEFATNTRRFGVRIAIFVVESDDEDYYKKPFNIDGIKPGSYKGISQVDPSWVAPILDQQSAANPASMHFYEPTYWLVAGQLYHRSHLIVSRYVEGVGCAGSFQVCFSIRAIDQLGEPGFEIVSDGWSDASEGILRERIVECLLSIRREMDEADRREMGDAYRAPRPSVDGSAEAP